MITVFVASPDIHAEQALGVLRLAGPLAMAGMRQIWWDETIDVAAQIAQSDLVVIQRNFPERKQVYAQIVSSARQAGKPVVFEIDDLLWELPIEHPDQQNDVYAAALFPMLQAAADADAITVASPSLQAYCRAFHPSVWLLPNYLDQRLWTLQSPRLHRAGQPVCIGYMGGSSHTPDLELIEPVLHSLCERYDSRLTLKFWGAQPPASLQKLPNTHWEPIHIVRYDEFAAYFSQQECDIWIAPLRPGKFNECKSAIKFLEYTANGAPGVYSRIAPYEQAVEQRETAQKITGLAQKITGLAQKITGLGLLAGSLEEWEASLTRLIEDGHLRQAIAIQAQEAVRKNWLLADHVVEWEQAYRQIIAAHAGIVETQKHAYLPRPIPAALAANLAQHGSAPLPSTEISAMANPQVSIVLVTYNNINLTRQCLDSIYARTSEPAFDVIVVDNASQDETPRVLLEYAAAYPNLKVILNPVNAGFARGNNIGAAAAAGEFLVFLNNDTVVTRGWLAGLIHHLQDPAVGMVGPVTNYSSNESRVAVDYDPSSPGLEGMEAFAEKYTRQHAGQAFEVEMLLLLCVALRRSVYDELGGIDERYGIGMFEDEDFANEAHQRGYKIVCAEDVYIHHWGSASFSKLGLAQYWLIHEENRIKFEEKWGRKWYPQLYRAELQREHIRQMVDGSLWLAKQVGEAGKTIERMDEGVKENERKANENWQRVMEYSDKLAEQTQKMVDQETKLVERECYIAEIHRSRAWRLVMLLRQVRLFLFPAHSFRERMARGAYRFFRSPVSQTGSFIRRIIARIWRARITRWVLRAITPRALKNFYHALGEEIPYTDRTQVVLYADPEILPDYAPRQALDVLPVGDRLPVKVSLISTVWNEADHARSWLESLLQQSRLPDEIVITDGGSTDNTVAIMREVAEISPIPIRVFEAPGANPSRGRNIAIEQATYSIIACTDSGCVLDKDWLKCLMTPFEHDPDIEVSAGYYQAIEKTEFDRICARLFVADLSQVDPQAFLPSGRSLAMKKSVWIKADGYPEWLTLSGEDTLFDFKVKMQTCKWAFVPQAKVAWRPPSPTSFVLKKVFRYSRGDGEAAILVNNYLQKIKNWIWTQFQRCFALLVVFLAILILGNRLFVPWSLAVIFGLLLFVGYRFTRSVHYIRQTHPLTSKQAIRFYFLSELVNTGQICGFIAGVANRKKVRQRKVELYQNQLKQILDKHPDDKGVVVYPPTHDWGYMFQRPQQIARAFARKGYLYFYCTKNEKTDACFGFYELGPGLYLANVPMEVFHFLRNPIVYIGSTWNRALLNDFDNPKTIYDHYDDLKVSSGRIEDHEALLRHADVVVVTSHGLLESVRAQRPDAIFAPNGVDYEWIQHYRPKPEDEAPPDLKTILDKKHPIIGYSGGLAEWFDYQLLTYLATARPDLEFVLIGVNYDGSLDRSGVINLGNVHWLGMKSFQELFQYVWRFDVATIPFKVNAITLATSPIKQFEYMACQKPVVATALPECKRYPDVLVAETYEQFASLLDKALKLRTDHDYLASLDRVARENTWDNRVEVIHSMISKIH